MSSRTNPFEEDTFDHTVDRMPISFEVNQNYLTQIK
jgi:hypothetical protein